MATATKKITPPKSSPAPRPSGKTAAKKPAPSAPTASSIPARPPVPPISEKPLKAKKPKLVRDSFTIPKSEYAVLDELKLRAAKLAHPIKKSELLRAGIKALMGMTDKALLEALQAVPAIKTGRPKTA